MLKKVIQDAINAQIAKEMYSSNLYLAISAYFHSVSLNGFAHWMRLQAEEEMLHAMKFYDFIINRGGRVELAALAAPPVEWTDPVHAFTNTVEHEETITNSINELAGLAHAEKDFATSSFLQWFIDEQVEEEANTNEILDRLKLIGNEKSGLFYLDNELKQRVPTTTASTEAK